VSRRYLTVLERRLMVDRARGRCEYCKCPDDYSLQSFDFDHIFPVSQGELTSLENLAYACGGCNGYHLNFINGCYNAFVKQVNSQDAVKEDEPCQLYFP
jgi:HNH endonuclease